MNRFGRFGLLKDQHNILEGSQRLEGEMLKRVQAYLLKITCDVIDTCEKEDITYFLGGGTALGAVRHGGFIPWDDDVDISMMSGDYARFKERFLQEHGDRYVIKDGTTPGFNVTLVRIVRKGSLLKRIDNADGFCVDIFLWENTPDNGLLRAFHGTACMAVGFVFSCWCITHDRKLYMPVIKRDPRLAPPMFFKMAVGWLAHILPMDTWRRIVWFFYRLCKNENSRYVTCPAGTLHYFGELHPREMLVPTVKMPFEGHQWDVAGDYVAHLTSLYGPDFMTPTPPEAREYHYVFELRFPDDDGQAQENNVNEEDGKMAEEKEEPDES